MLLLAMRRVKRWIKQTPVIWSAFRAVRASGEVAPKSQSPLRARLADEKVQTKPTLRHQEQQPRFYQDCGCCRRCHAYAAEAGGEC